MQSEQALNLFIILGELLILYGGIAEEQCCNNVRPIYLVDTS